MNKLMKQINPKALLLVAIATFLLVIGIQMSQSQRQWGEVQKTTVEGTKARNAAIGGVGGGVIGGVAGFLIGGVGVVLCGTGIGIPAGAGMIAAGVAVGAGSGAVTGAAVGDSSRVVDVVINHASPAYETWQWVAVVCISVVVYGLALHELSKAKQCQ